MVQSIVTKDVRGEENSRELHTFLRQILAESKQNKRKQEEKSVFLSLVWSKDLERYICHLMYSLQEMTKMVDEIAFNRIITSDLAIGMYSDRIVMGRPSNVLLASTPV